MTHRIWSLEAWRCAMRTRKNNSISKGFTLGNTAQCPHALADEFTPPAACKILDLQPVNLRILQATSVINSSRHHARPLYGIALGQYRTMSLAIP